jgi:hypothetical protein
MPICRVTAFTLWARSGVSDGTAAGASVPVVRRLYYSSGYVLVDDRVCKAVLRYARALAMNEQSDVVTVPVVTDDGTHGSAHLLIGPASELFSTPFNDTPDAEYDPEVVRELERMTAALQPYKPAWDSEMRDVPDVDL